MTLPLFVSSDCYKLLCKRRGDFDLKFINLPLPIKWPLETNEFLRMETQEGRHSGAEMSPICGNRCLGKSSTVGSTFVELNREVHTQRRLGSRPLSTLK